MKNRKYTVTIEVSKFPDETFNYVIQLSKWWPEEFIGDDLKLNSEFIFKAGEGHFSKNKVIDLVRGEKLAWIAIETLRTSDNFDWSGAKMMLELTPKGHNTEVSFTYDGVVLDDEEHRLTEICDFCIKNKLYNFIESFSAMIEADKSPQHVFNCLADVPKWWSEDFEGSSKQLNDQFIVHHPNQHYSRQRLVEVIPNERIVWSVEESTLYWLKSDQQEWTNTRMIFKITAHPDKTILHFTHEGLTPGKECYAMCSKGWTMIIKDWLFHYIRYGTSTPEMNKVAEIRNKILAENSK